MKQQAIVGPPSFTIDATAWHEEGATIAQEIAWSINHAFALCDEMKKHGMSAHDVMQRMTVRMSLAQDPLMQAAKIKALRVLWARMMRMLGAGDAPVIIHAQCSERMMTVQEPWDNVLRVTAAVLASHLGGVTPIDTSRIAKYIPTTQEYAETMLQHIEHVVALETGLGQYTDDVLAGSWVYEQWVDDLCKAAWNEVQREIRL